MSKRTDLLAIVSAFPQRRIVVVGDLVADRFLSGSISRVSREAPVLILRHEETDTRPGGAANCAANLAALELGLRWLALLVTTKRVWRCLRSWHPLGVNCDGVVVVPEEKTTTKIRVLAGQVHAARQQVIRIDHEPNRRDATGSRLQLQAKFRSAAGSADAVIISDYNYGAATESIAAEARCLMEERDVPVLVDSRYRLLQFSGFTSATPNEDEVEQLLNRRLSGEEDVALAGETLRQELACQALLVTRGSEGMILLQPKEAALRLEAVGSRQPVDVTGAGDTVIAAYSLGLACGASFPDAATIANHAGGVVVMKKGTATLTAGELTKSLARLSENEAADEPS